MKSKFDCSKVTTHLVGSPEIGERRKYMYIHPIFTLLLVGITALTTLGIVFKNRDKDAVNAMAIVAIVGVVAWASAQTTILGPAVAVGAAVWAWFLTLPQLKLSARIFLVLGQLPFLLAGDQAGLGLGASMMLFLLILLDLLMAGLVAIVAKSPQSQAE